MNKIILINYFLAEENRPKPRSNQGETVISSPFFIFNLFLNMLLRGIIL